MAHYYQTTALRALPRTGDMTYPGQLTGETVVRIVIGNQRDLVALPLGSSSRW